MAGDERLTVGLSIEAPGSSPPQPEVFETVLSSLPSGVIVADEAGSIVMINPSGARMLGQEARKLRGLQLVHVRGELEPMLWPTEKGEVLLLDAKADAQVLGFTSRDLGVGPGGGSVIVFSDITKQRKRQREEAHKQRLADLGGVVATLAHEIRNPVYAIATLARLLEDEEPVAASADCKMIVHKILEETQRISRLVDDVLGFGRERKLDLQAVDVRALLTMLVEDISHSQGIDQDLVPVTLTVDPLAFRAATDWRLDAEAVRQVFSNLIRNAVQAVHARADRAPHHGVVVRVRYETNADGEVLIVDIDDDGVGIREEDVAKIFEPFYTTRRSGSGLGMAVALGLVRQHGGYLDVRSTLGRGTTATVRFPK